MSKTSNWMRKAGINILDRTPLDEGKRDPELGSKAGQEAGQADSKKSGKGKGQHRLGRSIEPNPEPLKRRIWETPKRWKRRIKKIREIIKKVSNRIAEIAEFVWYKRPWRELSPEEQRIKEDYEHRKEMESLLKDEARLFRQRIVNRLNGRELCYRKRQYERDIFDAVLGAQVSSVRFSDIVLQPDAIYLKVDTIGLPRGVGVLDLVDESVLTDLSIACQHRVRAEYTAKKGLWYIVERASGVRGIPKHVRYQDALDAYPKTAGKFTFPAGVTENNKYIFRDLTSMPHLLIAGSTDAGKSNMMHIIISSLIMRTSPQDLRILMIDLKGGIECAIYEGIPHLLPIEGVTGSGIIYERDRVPDALDYLINEGQGRMAKLKAEGYQNIENYNKHRTTNRMPRIMLIIDEWADIRLVSRLGPKAEDKLSNIASRMRAVGIHVVLATQSPKRDVISTLVKTNLPGKMAFSCPTNTASILIIDSGAARGLEPRGRYIFQKGTEHMEIQAPYISPQHLKRIVGSVVKGDDKVLLRGHDVTPDEVVSVALDQYDGIMRKDDLYQEFRGRLTVRSLLDLLAEMDGQTYTARGETYQVEPPAGSRPRQLELQN